MNSTKCNTLQMQIQTNLLDFKSLKAGNKLEKKGREANTKVCNLKQKKLIYTCFNCETICFIIC